MLIMPKLNFSQNFIKNNNALPNSRSIRQDGRSILNYRMNNKLNFRSS